MTSKRGQFWTPDLPRHRALRNMRMKFASSRKDDSWADATQHSSVEVARAWLAEVYVSAPGPTM